MLSLGEIEVLIKMNHHTSFRVTSKKIHTQVGRIDILT